MKCGKTKLFGVETNSTRGEPPLCLWEIHVGAEFTSVQLLSDLTLFMVRLPNQPSPTGEGTKNPSPRGEGGVNFSGGAGLHPTRIGLSIRYYRQQAPVLIGAAPALNKKLTK